MKGTPLASPSPDHWPKQKSVAHPFRQVGDPPLGRMA